MAEQPVTGPPCDLYQRLAAETSQALAAVRAGSNSGALPERLTDLANAVRAVAEAELLIGASLGRGIRAGRCRLLPHAAACPCCSLRPAPEVPDTRRVGLAAVCEGQADEHDDEDQADEPGPDEEDR